MPPKNLKRKRCKPELACDACEYFTQELDDAPEGKFESNWKFKFELMKCTYVYYYIII